MRQKASRYRLKEGVFLLLGDLADYYNVEINQILAYLVSKRYLENNPESTSSFPIISISADSNLHVVFLLPEWENQLEKIIAESAKTSTPCLSKSEMISFIATEAHFVEFTLPLLQFNVHLTI
ncbi:MAG: hypothetical protein NTW50_00875 [Candidatus Berkelbacteria bacterium]|nr:hypothetical protein [Candidatus Berkelbacteria bacterium]